MKKTIKLIGIIAFAALIGFSFITCDHEGDPVIFLSATGGGTTLTLTFSDTLDGISASAGIKATDVTVTGAKVEAISGSNGTYTVEISGASGELTVSVAEKIQANGNAEDKSDWVYYTVIGKPIKVGP